MKRILFGLLVTLGVVVIGSGVYLQLDSKETEDTSFERLNTFNLDEVCQTDTLTSTYLNTSDYTLINLSYPDCVYEYDLSRWSKTLMSEDGNIEIDIAKKSDTRSNYINDNEDSLDSLKDEDSYSDIYYTDTLELNYNNYNISLVEANYSYLDVYYDIWYVALEIDSDNILIYEITVKNGVMSYDTILNFLNEVTISEDGASFKITVENDNYQEGTIYQNLDNSYSHGYKINFKVSSSYPEVESYSSDYDNIVFTYEDTLSKVYSEMSIEKSSDYDSLEELTNYFHESSVSYYNENTDKYQNMIDTSVKKVTINDKDIYYFIYQYDYYTDDGSYSFSGAFSYIYYEVTTNYYLKIYLNTKNVTINTDLISEFLTFSVEEY